MPIPLLLCAGLIQAPHSLPTWQPQRLAEGVHAFVTPASTGAVVTGNCLVVIGSEGVLVVDSGHFPTQAQALIAQIKAWTSQPVRVLVNTHWHPDHNAGNALFQEAFPGVQIVSTEATRRGIVEWLPKKEVDEGLISQVRATAARGAHPDGRRLGEAEQRYYTQVAREFEAFLPELRRAGHADPTLTFPDRITVHLGNQVAEVHFLGRGTTSGDAVVFLPASGILATGDLLVHPVPYPFGSHIREWPGTLRRMKALGATTLVPGHGPVLRDGAFLDQCIELLERTWAHALMGVQAGKTDAEILTGTGLDDLRNRFAGQDPGLRYTFDQTFLATALRRALREVREGALQDEE